MARLTTYVMAAVLFASSAAQSNMIVNGGFESPLIPGGSFAVFASIPGWTSSMGAGIEIQNNVAGAPSEGQQFVELDSHNNSNMFQDVVTQSGGLYLLSFLYSPRPGVSAASNVIDVLVDGILLLSLAQNGGGATNFQNFSLTFVGDGLSRIEFRANGINESLGGYVDDVRLVVPEPGGLLLLATAAVTGFAATRRRRAR